MEKKQKSGFFTRLATLVVERRNFMFLLFACVCAFCVFSMRWVSINDDLTVYLSKDSETRIGLDIMETQFTQFATADVMAANVTYPKALELKELIEGVEGVHDVAFDNTDNHYTSACALFTVTLDGETTDQISLDAMDEIREKLSGYDLYISTEVGNPLGGIIQREMVVVDIIAVIIIVSVLLMTSKSYAEIPILLITFGAAALLNMGTNYWLGTISFVSNSIAIVLQLALAVDYAIILCHRFTEERENKPAKEAAVSALSKAMPEISASSLTTISGLVALTLMNFRLGYDMGVVLIKAIICSMLSVFMLMPGLLVLLSGWIDKTRHKNFVPKIDFLGRFTYKTRYIIPPVFLVIVAAAFVLSGRCPYVYGYSTLDTLKQNEIKIADKTIDETFGADNFVALLVPAGDYKKEAALVEELESYAQVRETLSLSGIEAMSGYTLTSALTPRQFAELADLDVGVARTLFTAYGVNNEDYGRIVADVDSYSVPLIDMFSYLYERQQEGYVELDAETRDMLSDLNTQLDYARVQLRGEDWSRMVLFLNLPEESPETFEFLDTIHAVTAKYYDESYLAGMSVNEYDLSKSFSDDNMLISVLSAVFVIIVLLFTFRSVGLPVLLIAVIQSSIWINFSFPYLMEKNLFFIAYLIVSAIQMGANIDYAIVISSRYMALKREMPIKEAMTETLNHAFPTIITSGLMLASAGFIIGLLTSDNSISSIGICIGRGTAISIVLVMCVLPQILLLGDILIEKTSFRFASPNILRTEQGTIRLRGRVRGQVSGYIDADVRGLFQGSINAMVDIGNAEVIASAPPAVPERAEEAEKEAAHES